MTTAHLPDGLFERAGLSADDVAQWVTAPAPAGRDDYPAAAHAASVFLTRGDDLLRRLAAPAGPTDDFLRSHTADLYDALTGHGTRWLRVEELAAAAAAAVPGLTPGPAQLDTERARMLADKEG